MCWGFLLTNNCFVPSNNHQQQQYQTSQGRLGGIGQVKMEPLLLNDQQKQKSQQMLALQNIVQAKMERQQVQTMRKLPPVKSLQQGHKLTFALCNKAIVLVLY